jgi:hypothetical protein
MTFAESTHADRSTVEHMDGARAEVSTVHLSSLPVGHAWRAAGLDDARVTALARRYPRLPPILVRGDDHLVVDGAHTVAAARRLGMHVAYVRWFDGSWAEAAETFVLRNGTDGMPLTSEDRRSLMSSLLGAQPSWSDRRIAQVCGGSPKLVARLRRDLTGKRQPHSVEKRVGRDGRARPVRGGAMRERIVDMLERRPDASLRTVATALGVSPETVRSVRKELARPSPPSVDRSEPHRVRETSIDDLLEYRRRREVPAPWRADSAFSSTRSGTEFVEWFEATAIREEQGRIEEVPLSRVYEIADEARRRAAFWTGFADSLEARTRGRR